VCIINPYYEHLQLMSMAMELSSAKGLLYCNLTLSRHNSSISNIRSMWGLQMNSA